VADAFVAAMKRETVAMFGEQPQQSPSFGRLINERAWDRVNGLVQVRERGECSRLSRLAMRNTRWLFSVHRASHSDHPHPVPLPEGWFGGALARSRTRAPTHSRSLQPLTRERANARTCGRTGGRADGRTGGFNGGVQADKKFVVHGGEGERAERYQAPTLLDFGTDFAAFKASASMADEIFGPVFPIYRYSDLDACVRFVCEGEKPLALYVFSEDQAVTDKVLHETTAGGVNVNDVMMHLSNANLPFGGVGRSGMGSYHGKFSFDAFTHAKAVLRKTCEGDFPQRYAPYPQPKAKL
jgi:acyl-CoA reductase-like NAD-dependent aldehyde dehydrogenase